MLILTITISITITSTIAIIAMENSSTITVITYSYYNLYFNHCYATFLNHFYRWSSRFGNLEIWEGVLVFVRARPCLDHLQREYSQLRDLSFRSQSMLPGILVGIFTTWKSKRPQLALWAAYVAHRNFRLSTELPESQPSTLECPKLQVRYPPYLLHTPEYYLPKSS